MGEDTGADGNLSGIGFEGLQDRRGFLRNGSFFQGLFQTSDRFGTFHIIRYPSAQCEFRQRNGIGTVAGRFTGRNEFVCGGNFIMDHSAQPDQEILFWLWHFRPVPDVGPEPELLVRKGITESEIAAFLIDCVVIFILPGGDLVLHVCGSCQDPAVCRGSGDGTGIHQCHCRDLPAAGFGSFPVGEITGGMPDGKGVVGRRISRAEAGSAEAWLHDGTGEGQVCGNAVFHDRQIDRRAGRINGQVEISVSDAFAAQDIGCFRNIFIHAAGASCDNALVAEDLTVLPDAAKKIHCDLAVQGSIAFLLDLPEDAFRILLEFMDGIGFGRMEGQCDHRFHFIQMNGDHTVISGAFLR